MELHDTVEHNGLRACKQCGVERDPEQFRVRAKRKADGTPYYWLERRCLICEREKKKRERKEVKARREHELEIGRSLIGLSPSPYRTFFCEVKPTL